MKNPILEPDPILNESNIRLLEKNQEELITFQIEKNDFRPKNLHDEKYKFD